MDLYMCRKCGHHQLLDIVKPDLLYGSYIYTSSSSPDLKLHFKNYGEYLIFSDVDIQFFRNFKSNILKKIKNYDLVAQQSASKQWLIDKGHNLCSGFFIFKANKEVISLFETMQNCIDISNDNVADQICLNINKDSVNWGKLSKKYFNTGMVTGGQEWGSVKAKYIPKDLYLHHANFVKTLPKKMEAMEAVRLRQQP